MKEAKGWLWAVKAPLHTQSTSWECGTVARSTTQAVCLRLVSHGLVTQISENRVSEAATTGGMRLRQQGLKKIRIENDDETEGSNDVGSGYFVQVSDLGNRVCRPKAKLYNDYRPCTNDASYTNTMSSLTYLLPARQDLKRYTHSAMTPLGVLAVASLMAATTTLGRYLIGYILLEAIYLIYYRLRPHLEGTHDASQISTSTPGLGLWKDILIALDDGESTVDQWISFVFGVMVDQVRRENVEVLLAGMSRPIYGGYRESRLTDRIDLLLVPRSTPGRSAQVSRFEQSSHRA